MSKEVTTLSELRSKIAEYQTKYPKPWLVIEPGGPYNWETSGQDRLPNANLPGIYAFLRAKKSRRDLEVLYIGKCHRWSKVLGKDKRRLAARLTGEYLEKAADNSEQRYQLRSTYQKKWKEKLPTHVMTWAMLPEDMFFEAGALEDFLLSELPTRYNKVGQ